MKKIWFTFIFICMTCYIHAQFVINNHAVHYDSRTSTWLATIPENMFGKDCLLTISILNGWNKLTIDNELVNNKYTFKNLSAESFYKISITNKDNHTITGILQFTFLPIVHLNGDFGYEYQNGIVNISNPDEESNDDSFTARIKWRGGTTNTNDKHKRNYNIKFDTDIKLFDMRKDNNWMLDAGQPDVFRMRNRIAMDLWNDMAHKPYYVDQEPKARNGVSGIIVEVFLNDEYRGIYNLSEKLDRKQMKLKKVDEFGEIHGLLYKGKIYKNTSMNDSIYKYDNFSDTLLGYEVKYPEPGDDCDSTDWKPLVDINNKILILCYDAKQFEEQVEDLLDVPVMIDYNVFLSSINAIDNSGKNMFWAIYDKATTQRMTLAPWDLDCTFGQRWGGILANMENDHTSPEYFSDVAVAGFFNFNRTNALQYNDRVNERYQELRQDGNILSTDSLIKRITKYYNAIKKSGAAQRETDKWSGDSDIKGEVIDFDKEYEYICDWITKHLEAVDKKGFPVQYDKEYIDRIFANITSLTINNKSDKYIYTLNGQRIDSTKPLKHGIYIRKGKKIIIK